MLFSLLFFGIRPYRAAQQAIGENIIDIVKFLRIKADFYLPDTDIDANYHKVISQQIHVAQHQDAVRELLFKTRQIVNESTATGRKLLFTFVETVDLFENITASYYDYELLRKQYGHTGILDRIGLTLKKMAAELDEYIGTLRQIRQGDAFNNWFRRQAEKDRLQGPPQRDNAVSAAN